MYVHHESCFETCVDNACEFFDGYVSLSSGLESYWIELAQTRYNGTSIIHLMIMIEQQ